MEIKRYALGDLGANCYVIINSQTKNAIAVDIGDSAPFLMMEELKHGFKITHVLLTHSHFDHIGGVAPFVKRGATAYIGKGDLEGVSNEELNLSYHFNKSVEPFNATAVLGGDTLEINGFSIQVIDTPGHTAGGVTYKINDCLFTGDTVFQGSFGRVDFPGGNVKDLCFSIRKIFGYENGVIYSGHGDITTVKQEKETNPIKYYDKY